MTDEKNKIVDILIEDFIKVLGISDKWEPDNNILLELKNMIDSLASVDIKSFEERKSSIFYFVVVESFHDYSNGGMLCIRFYFAVDQV